MGGGIAQLGLSRGQAPAHITGACSGGLSSQADAVFCTGFGRRREVKECLAQEGGAEEKEEGEESCSDRDCSWALCRDGGTQRGTLVRWRSLESSLASVRR